MGIANKINRSVVNWDVATDGAVFIKAADLEVGKEYPFFGCWVTPDRGYGEGGVIISQKDDKIVLVNTPASFVGSIKLIRNDEESINQIRDKKLNFKVTTYNSKKFKKQCFDIKLVDVE